MADRKLKPEKTALIIQDLQNDVISDGGAFASSGAPAHAKKQKVVENVSKLAEAMRKAGSIVIHVHYVVDPGAPGLKLNAPLFRGIADGKAVVRGTWGAAAVAGLEPQRGGGLFRCTQRCRAQRRASAQRHAALQRRTDRC